ncbi:MAG: exosome complex protein Rrp42 [Candidatus Aenigmarchaeota archaeon]|nr:exosome complex protein Rrp42 [Candidatus Aenigmarchaeota archaeon]
MIEIDPLLVREVIEDGKRVDGRPLDGYREVSIETNVVPSAEGSARVRLGDTEVLAGVKIDVGTPFGDTPDEGVLMVGTEFVPLASPEFESGPPGEEAVEVARVVDRAIRESKSIDVKKLCITPKEKVWMVYVDVDVLDDNGNLIDASSLAALAALMTAKMPVLNEDGRVDHDKKGTEPLPVTGRPLCTTFVKIGDKIIADPSSAEMHALDARLTVGTFEKDGHVKLCSMQKGGSMGLTLDEIDTIVKLAEQKGAELRKHIK